MQPNMYFTFKIDTVYYSTSKFVLRPHLTHATMSPLTLSLSPSFLLSLPPPSPHTHTAHTPDNSFLGFVVEQHRSTSSPPPPDSQKSLVYGKELYMWKGKSDYLSIIAKYFDVHATIGSTVGKRDKLDWSLVPSFVHNHGILGGAELQQLLQVSH